MCIMKTMDGFQNTFAPRKSRALIPFVHKLSEVSSYSASNLTRIPYDMLYYVKLRLKNFLTARNK